MALTNAGFSGRQNRAGSGDRRIGRQRSDATSACPGRETRHLKHDQSWESDHAKAFGFNEVIDTSVEKLGDGVRSYYRHYGADIVIDGIGGDVLSEALGALASGGNLTTLGYAAGRKATIDVTNLIWKQASIKSFILFAQPQAAWDDAGILSSLCFDPARSNRSWLRPSRWPKRRMLCVTWLRAALSAESSSHSDKL